MVAEARAAMTQPTFLALIKRAAFTEALQHADYVQLVCATHEPGVAVPTRYLNTDVRTIVLNIGYRLPVPISDLVIDEWGVCGTLTFDRKPFYVKLPWACVWNINHPHSPVGMMFSMEPGGANSLLPEPAPQVERPALKLVK